jgi:capsular exopolysaccharide synthesis family protein
MMNQNEMNSQNGLNIFTLLRLIIRNIWIIVPCIILTLGLAYVYNRFTIPSYYVSSTLLLKQNTRNPWASEGERFINNDLLYQTQSIENEMTIIKSSPIIEQMVKNLDLEVTYFEYVDYQYYIAYKSVPFKVFIFKDHPQLIETLFDIVVNADGSFKIVLNKQNATVYNYNTNQILEVKEEHELSLNGSIGEILETSDFKLLITINDNENLQQLEGRNFAFKLTTMEELTKQFKSALEYSVPNKDATVVQIGMTTSSVKLAQDVINELMRVYISSKLDEKNHLANITIDYIEKQLAEVSTSLNSTEDNLKRFKSANRAMNVDEQASRLSEQQLNLQNQLAELMVKKRYYDYIKEYNSGTADENQIVTPTSMGVNDVALNRLVEELATAQTQLDALVKNNQERNPKVSRLRIQIRNLKNSIIENISTSERANDLSISDLQGRIEQLDSRISRLPATQMQLGGIERTFNLNDAIYNYLLEKQAEAKITKASNLSDIVIIEPAQMVGNSPVSPKYMFNYLISIILGFGIPFGIIFLKYFLKSTINTQEEIEGITNAPILGKVLHYKNKKEKNVFVTAPNNKTAENFRTLRTNLNFALGGNTAKTILVSSCVSGEGKTFSSLNIAAAYAQIDKRTVLVNFDLRNSQSFLKEKDNNNSGLSLFLSNEVELNSIIQKSYFKTLDIINAGPVPPNPLELMENEKTIRLFEYLKKNYDYIIIDTPPMAQVSDAFTIVQHADLVLLVVRYSVTKKKLLRLVLHELKTKNINNVNIILNDNKMLSEQMGYGYYNR